MGRQLPAAMLVTLLALSSAACGGDSDDGVPAEETTSQADDTTTDDQGAEQSNAGSDDQSDDQESDKPGKHAGGHEHGALPNDLPSPKSADPDDLPIDADVVMRTCEDIEPKDTWPSIDDVYLDPGAHNVVATADVDVKGQTVKMVCDVAGSANNPQVMAYNPAE